MTEDDLQATLPVARRIWASLLAATVIYFAMLWYLGSRPPTGNLDVLRPLLMALAVVQGVVVLVLYRRTAPAGTAWPEDPGAAQGMFMRLIACWVLAEAVALYGLVLGMLGAVSLQEASLFFVGATALLLMTRPPG